jgi:hypothetical protein
MVGVRAFREAVGVYDEVMKNLKRVVIRERGLWAFQRYTKRS